MKIKTIRHLAFVECFYRDSEFIVVVVVVVVVDPIIIIIIISAVLFVFGYRSVNVFQ
jgi:hypothetical protein